MQGKDQSIEFAELSQIEKVLIQFTYSWQK